MARSPRWRDDTPVGHEAERRITGSGSRLDRQEQARRHHDGQQSAQSSPPSRMKGIPRRFALHDRFRVGADAVPFFLVQVIGPSKGRLQARDPTRYAGMESGLSQVFSNGKSPSPLKA